MLVHWGIVVWILGFRVEIYVCYTVVFDGAVKVVRVVFVYVMVDAVGCGFIVCFGCAGVVVIIVYCCSVFIGVFCVIDFFGCVQIFVFIGIFKGWVRVGCFEFFCIVV